MNGHDDGPIKINLGCGKNKLRGWQNYDVEVDIKSPLPFGDETASYMLAEHVVEHVHYRHAVAFLLECRRVLVSGGVLRIIVPSVERVMKYADDDYIKFVSRWAPTRDKRGAMHAILFAHGHRTAWTEGLMHTTLFFAGLEPRLCAPNVSLHEELNKIDGHGKVIGDTNNWIESSVFEGTKQGDAL